MEIRLITREESDAFLHLLCAVFAIDQERAKVAFYSEPIFGMTKKWALLINNEIISICSTSPLEFGWGKGYGIAGVATAKEYRGRGYASQLLEYVHRQYLADHIPNAYLFAHEPNLYRRNGFEVIDDVIRGQISIRPKIESNCSVESESVRVQYRQWASMHPSRLIRDAHKWAVWDWSLKSPIAAGTGYICQEGSQIREAIGVEGLDLGWPVPRGTEWCGLKSMTEMMRVPILNPVRTLYFMAKSNQDRPQMFLTDQF